MSEVYELAIAVPRLLAALAEVERARGARAPRRHPVGLRPSIPQLAAFRVEIAAAQARHRELVEITFRGREKSRGRCRCGRRWPCVAARLAELADALLKSAAWAERADKALVQLVAHNLEPAIAARLHREYVALVAALTANEAGWEGKT